jgi:hypothetical protein
MSKEHGDAALKMFLLRELNRLHKLREFVDGEAEKARINQSKSSEFLKDIRDTVSEWRKEMEKEHGMVFSEPSYQEAFREFSTHISKLTKEFEKRSVLYEIKISNDPIISELRSAISRSASDNEAKEWIRNNLHRVPSKFRDKLLLIIS